MYEINIETFQGPLDVLLGLISKQKVKIEEVSIDEQDIEKVINFLDKKEIPQNLNLEFYSYDELDNEVDNITNQIYKNFIDIH